MVKHEITKFDKKKSRIYLNGERLQNAAVQQRISMHKQKLGRQIDFFCYKEDGGYLLGSLPTIVQDIGEIHYPLDDHDWLCIHNPNPNHVSHMETIGRGFLERQGLITGIRSQHSICKGNLPYNLITVFLRRVF